MNLAAATQLSWALNDSNSSSFSSSFSSSSLLSLSLFLTSGEEWVRTELDKGWKRIRRCNGSS